MRDIDHGDLDRISSQHSVRRPDGRMNRKSIADEENSTSSLVTIHEDTMDTHSRLLETALNPRE